MNTEKIMLYTGDCISIMEKYSDNEFDLILTDPPYNVGCTYGCEKFSDTKSPEEYLEWSRQWFIEATRISDTLIFTPGFGNLQMWLTEIEYPRGIACWFAPNQLSHSDIGGWNHWEPILCYGNIRLSKNAFHHNIKKQRDVGNHPCPKPLSLFGDIIDSCRKEITSILDPFAGSGTTLVAGYMRNINCIGIDINYKNEDIIQKRINKIGGLRGWL